MTKTKDSFEKLFTTIKTLRSPGGCPWDLEQTPKTMREPLLEETYEAIDAISEDDFPHAMEELGDVFLNTLMISFMNEQAGNFTVQDVLENVNDKLIRRHPHVFGEQSDVKTPKEVLKQWDNIKQTVEKRESTESVLDSVPRSFPPLERAYKLSKKAAKKGFEEAISTSDTAHIEEELGDVFYSLVQVARFLDQNPEIALNTANRKFEKRFRHVESRMNENNLQWSSDNFDKMDEFWNEAKQS